MAAGITLWVRAGDAASGDALRFLKSNGYAADAVRDLDREPPTEAERAALAKGGLDPAALKAPVLLTPRGAVMGFRERRWRDFLDIGKGRS
jgi:arsenate reductase-like glutaredoxin family protein